MALVYLKGEDVETTVSRQRARLCGILNETYVYHCQLLGYTSQAQDTKYCFPLKEKMEAVLDENEEPVLDECGQQAYQGLGEFCSEIDTEQDEYSSLPTIHVNRLVSRATMEADGWFANE
jgi:hypothetical protein